MLDLLLKYVTEILEKNEVSFVGLGFNEDNSFRVDFAENTTEEEKQMAYALLQKDYTADVLAYKALQDYDTVMGREAEDLVTLKLSLKMEAPQILIDRYNIKQQLRQDYLSLL